MPSILGYCVDQIAVEPFISVDGNQDPTYGARVIVPARIEERTRTMQKSDGTWVTVQTVVGTTYQLKDRDRVWCAPQVGDAPRVFPAGFTFVDADARVPQAIDRGRRKMGIGGHVEAGF